MNHLVRGEDYLARTPKFRLVGRDAELKQLSAILLRKSANSILLVGPGGVGCTALCRGLQAIKNEPDTPFDIVSKRLFWLDTDELFASGDGDKIKESFQRVLQHLYRTPDTVLIVEDTRDFIEAARNNGTTHFINALCLAIKLNKVQVLLEARDDDLDLILKSHSDLRELFTLIDLEEPNGDILLQIVKHAAQDLQEFHRIRIPEEAIKTAIELTTKYRSEDGGISRAQPERSVSLLDRALSIYRLDAHRVAPGLEEAESALRRSDSKQKKDAAETAIASLKAKWSLHQSEINSLYQRQRDGETLSWS
ncbi:MAG: hypothetical protein HC855_01145 [Rhizobiales bacterium]|nr:hypothetical protein [Hyphomicrobiales bacterium]